MFLWKATDEKGEISQANFIKNGTSIKWGKRAGVMCWVSTPVVGPHGYGEGYWRKAGKKITQEVLDYIEKNFQTLKS